MQRGPSERRSTSTTPTPSRCARVRASPQGGGDATLPGTSHASPPLPLPPPGGDEGVARRCGGRALCRRPAGVDAARLCGAGPRGLPAQSGGAPFGAAHRRGGGGAAAVADRGRAHRRCASARRDDAPPEPARGRGALPRERLRPSSRVRQRLSRGRRGRRRAARALRAEARPHARRAGPGRLAGRL